MVRGGQLMGRELRKVPSNWEHPRKVDGSYQPLHDKPYAHAMREWEFAHDNFARGLDHNGDPLPASASNHSFEDWYGDAPNAIHYRADWPLESITHFQMYEDTTEGTPISPVFATPEECARWCADNGASAFGDDTADYDWWLRVCQGTAGFGLMVDALTGVSEPA
jgi:hypothetical protein